MSDRARRVSLRDLLWNTAERRPRVPIRLALTTLIVVAFLGLATLLLAVVLALFESDTVQFLASQLFRASLVLAVLAAAVLIDRRPIADLGFDLDRQWWLDLLFGLLLGAISMSAVFFVAQSTGWIRVTGYFVTGALPWDFWLGFAALTIQFGLVGFSEEVVARGYLLKNLGEGSTGYLSERGSVLIAVLLSSVLFGAAHATNPNATGVSTLALSLLGNLFAVGYVFTGRLAIPIGLHTTWNLFQGGVFGFAVSGGHSGISIINIDDTGPAVITGGAFGPEAGRLGIGAMLVGIVVILGYVRWQYGVLRISSRVTTPMLRWQRVDDS